jgi:hypothetical protein
MEQLGGIDKANKCRRLCGRLRHVKNFQALPLIGRRLHPGGRLSEQVV